MFIRAGYEIAFKFAQPAVMTFLLYVLPSRVKDLRSPDSLTVDPPLPVTDFTDCFGNRCARIVAPPGVLQVRGDFVIEDSGLPMPEAPDAIQHQVEDLPPEHLQFLLPSRYCEVDRFLDIAWQIFGDTPPGWARVQAICDWVHNHIEFGYQYARPTKTAYETYEEKRGVCRDYTHLAITFCRAMNIPARYATGYLGDIGVPQNPAPMDFSACFQVYLGGQWYTFDARFNQRRIGWILMAIGRDAVDCAITTSFGPHTLEKFLVWSDEVETADISSKRS